MTATNAVNVATKTRVTSRSVGDHMAVGCHCDLSKTVVFNLVAINKNACASVVHTVVSGTLNVFFATSQAVYDAFKGQP